MELEKTARLLGTRMAVAKAAGVAPSVISGWGEFNEVPQQYRVKVKKALRKRKRQIDKDYNEVMK